MGKITEEMRDDVFVLLRIFLGRLPSERAISEAISRSLVENVAWIITGTEFRDNVLRRIINGFSTIHDDKELPIFAQDRKWLINHLKISESSIGTIQKAGSWHELLTAIVLDSSVQALVTSTFGNSRRASQFMEDIATLGQRDHRSPQVEQKDSAEAPARSEALVGDVQPVVPVEAPVGPQTARKEDLSAAHVILALRPGQVKAKLNDLFKKSEHIEILRIHEAALSGGYDPSLVAYITYMCARVYLRMFMSRSAYDITNSLVPRLNDLSFFSETERVRLLKTHALAAIRTGQAAKGLDVYRSLISLYPTDWEAYFFLGDFSIGIQPDFAEQCLRACLECGKELSPSQTTTIMEFLDQRGDRAFLVRTLGALPDKTKLYPDFHTCLANAALRTGVRAPWRKHMASHFEVQGLSGADLLVEREDSLFGFGEAEHQKITNNPLVSIVMTSFNASATIGEAIKSVLRQTCTNIELIVVDDCSSDQSQSIVAALANEDSRVKPLVTASNGGTYCAKNLGIESAKGEYITFHDSDDWMHPQRIERHLAQMKGGRAASVSNWIRMTAAGEAILRKGGGFIHRNPASTFISRQALQRVGFFDSVRTGADTEMLWRLKNTFGHDAVLEFDDVLAIGLQHDNSLTTSGATAFDEFRYSPVRLEYWESWVAWHFSSLRQGRQLFLPRLQPNREFEAPEGITVSPE